MYALVRIIVLFPFAVAAMVYLWVRAANWYLRFQEASGQAAESELTSTFVMPMQSIPTQQDEELAEIRKRFLRNKRAFFAILIFYFLWFVGNFLFG